MRKKILLKGPLLTRSGYGEQARFALRSLQSQQDRFEIFIQPIVWGHTSWMNEMNEERQWIDQTIEKTIGYIQQGGQFDMSLQVTIPNEWEKLAPVNIGYTAGIETTKVSHQWLLKANEVIDKIIFVSTHSEDVMRSSVYEAHNEATNERVTLNLTKPTTAVNYPVKSYDNLPKLNLNLKHDTNFLCVAQFGPRKNLPNTIKWFLEEFKDEEVGLVIKTNLMKNCLMDREKVLDEIKKISNQVPDHKCKLYLLHGTMTDEEMHSLYQHSQIKALLALPHGEGFGLPLFEAAYSGLPVIATGWSGQMDFLCDEQGKEHFYNVSFDLQPVQDNVVWDGVLIKESMWAFARETSAKENMRQCYEDLQNNTGVANTACEYSQTLFERFAPEKMYKQFADAVYAPSAEEAKWEEELSTVELV